MESDQHSQDDTSRVELDAPTTRPSLGRSPNSTPILAGLPRLNTQLEPRPSPDEHRLSDYYLKRISTAPALGASTSTTRPQSHTFPMFHSTLDYALVRDFAYLPDNPLHYGAPLDAPTGATTPASEIGRRMSDPEDYSIMSTVETDGEGSYFQLPSRTFGDSPEDARYFGYGSGHARGRSNVLDYDSNRDMHRSNDTRGMEEANRILYPDAGQSHRHNREDLEHSLPELQITDSPSQSPSEAYDDEDFDAMLSPDDGYPGKALALFDFQQENDNELPFSEGQVLWINYRHGEGWLVAQHPETGESGLVPEEYVRLLRDIEDGLHGLKDESYDLDSPAGVDIDTPTEASMRGGAPDFRPPAEEDPPSTLQPQEAGSTSQEVTPVSKTPSSTIEAVSAR